MLSQWETVQFMTRWGLYLALSGVVGGTGSLFLIRQYVPALAPKLKCYVTISAALGVILSFVYFWSQMGGLLEASWWRSYDREMAVFLLETPIGSYLKYCVSGYLLVLIGQSFPRISNTESYWFYLLNVRSIFSVLGIILLIISYSKVGHSVAQSWYISLALWCHVAAAAWWIGSVVPLWWVTRSNDLIAIKKTLEYFGQLAAVPVVLLLICGVVMGLIYLGMESWWSLKYGQLLISKIVLVSLLLALALFHKWYLVPRLSQLDSLPSMRRSLLIEILFMSAVLGLTAYLSTFVALH
ncbi:hypothetical protein FJM67_15720 [Maribrevibacterium harenarium]|uniref:Copper resistance protein D n=1 Tax=Maribrevibacterium harenarium TaxID=2589817 RepID=A0A501WLV6_9GAMM|nr:CopD family protein [Maribrevibacterium harenarium]TPE46676.1 hypothetical protein FJM67_15720 [Maribrevibacterium harenarium]